jgi:hypothetical protein
MKEADPALLRAQSGIAPAMVLIGDWIGTGQAHGEPITATLKVRSVLSDTQVEVWERVGVGDDAHEDVCFYRFDAGSGQIRVLHLMSPAAVAEYAVEVAADGLVWVTPPKSPAVLWTLQGAELVSEVIWPDQRVAEVKLRYRRLANP